MIFFVNFIYSALAPTFLCFMLLNCFVTEPKKHKFVYLLVIFVAFCGFFEQKLATIALYDSLNIIILRLVVMSVWLIFALLAIFKIRKFYYILAFTLFFLAGAEYANLNKDLSLSGTSIINTDFIENVSYAFLGFLIVQFVAFGVVKLTKDMQSEWLFWAIFIASVVLYLLSNFGEIMLYGLKNDIIEFSKARLSFTAKVTYFDFLNVYFYMAFFAVFLLVFFIKRSKFNPNLALILLRKLKRQILSEKRWLNASLSTLVLAVFLLGYYDLYASKPPSISDSVIINPNKNNEFVIDTKEMTDKLYRFAYITEDGKKVRFFVIDRYPGQGKFVAVFDACMICGDMGYIKEDNQLICISCNVRIFLPSVGKAGGCNPIPFKYKLENGKIIIKKEEITAGAGYFSEVVPIKVKDPISGANLLNTEAKFTYTYYGKTFYFENEQNADKFKATPETYAPEFEKRKFRVQGHKEQ